jgi:hypothetical protein
MDDHYCLYAVTWANCPVEGFGPGVDPRFAVEVVRYGQLAALASRVGLDQFDLTKLQEGTADLPWLSTVAVRHNAIIAAAARNAAVLPMRLGIFFASRSSLIGRLARYEADAAEFLRRLGDRQEWAVKIYVDENHAQMVHGPGETGRGGTQYLAAKGLQLDRRRQVDAVIRQAALTVEARLKGMTDAWQRLRPLATALTNRPEKMVWNGAFLLSRSTIDSFQTACERLRSELAAKGLIVEARGPWPPYHFCPSFEPQPEHSPCPSTC